MKTLKEKLEEILKKSMNKRKKWEHQLIILMKYNGQSRDYFLSMEKFKQKRRFRMTLKEKELLLEIGKYLKNKGWKPIIISFKGIIKRELKYNYSLIIDFTGKKLKQKGDLE
ncbi:MAG TPA: hypothetical protein ENI61_03940 [Ignavibacteria bacterium]|nr:hypothetical protein [Ignavibacteria bacterium]